MIGSDHDLSIPHVDLPSSRTQWPWRVRLRRSVWQVFLMPLVRYAPRPFNLLRVWLLRAAGARIGKNCLIMPGVKVLIPWHLVLEDCVGVGPHVEFYNHGQIRVKSNTLISQYSFLCTSGHDYTLPDMPLTYADIEIGRECWIAAGVFVGPGVSIGDGTIVGAHSVVTRSMPARMVCAGNPCKPFKARVLQTRQPVGSVAG